jgi:pimeloyl-ACP methyl ester carboxylesterase
MRRLVAVGLFLASIATLWSAFGTAGPAKQASIGKVAFKSCRVEGVNREALCGVYEVFENRRTKAGRKLPLKVVVIPALQPHPDQGPVFYMAGGPGEAATELTELVYSWGDADEHDVVMIDERGTGEGHRLDCESSGSDEKLEDYLNGPFNPEAARICSEKLASKVDLTQYTTPNFADDVDEIRAAMGYDKINLNAGSFGTYAAQIYARRHGEHVRTAYLTSLVTLSERVPLHHARNAQLGLDQLFKDCEQDAACHAAYPKFRENFATVLGEARKAPIATWVKHPVTGAKTEIHLNERAFADAVRTMMYRSASAHEIPFLIAQALAGDFHPFAEAALQSNRNIYSGDRMGLYYCITCGEFVSQIRPGDVAPAIAGSYLGGWRVRDQMAACREWPKPELPSDYFEPFRLDTPAVLVSGNTDSASPPICGKEAKSYMPNAIHVIVPGGAHTPEDPCTRRIRRELYRTGATKDIDLSCVSKIRPPPFKLPTDPEAQTPAP